MWICLKCNTENEYNFCVNCRCSKEESEQPTRQQPATEQPISQEPVPQQEVTEQSTSQQPISTEKSSKKGCIIAIVVVIALIALFATLIFFAARLIMNNDGNDTRDAETYIEEDEDYNDESADTRFGESPFNIGVWGSAQVSEIDNGIITLEVPIPPDTRARDIEIDGSSLVIQKGVGDEYFVVRVYLSEEREEDFDEYSNNEVSNALDWYNEETREVIDYSLYIETDATLLIVHWEDEFGDGVTFITIKKIEGFFLVTDISFESLENREDFFEAYGFNVHFESTIRDVFDAWPLIARDAPEEEDNGNEDEGAEWTTAQLDSWVDMMDEYMEVSGLTMDLYFYIWDAVILNETVHVDYPNADVDRLIELHTEFDNRFDEMLGLDIDVDLTRAYDSEHNQNAFQQKRELISEHERFYESFRAALEGR